MDFQIIGADIPATRSKLAALPWASLPDGQCFQVPVTVPEGGDLAKSTIKLVDALRVYGAKIGKTQNPPCSYTVRAVTVDGVNFVRVWRTAARPARPRTDKKPKKKNAAA
jgi:hypothetical protein